MSWTYGAEHELADWDRRKGLPPGCWMDLRDLTMVNSNGIAVDPKGRHYPYGGELCTRPTDTPWGQVEVLREMKALHPDAAINYRSNLHIHIRAPGLRDDIEQLRMLARFNRRWLRKVLDLVEPIPIPTHEEYPIEEEYLGAYKRYRRRRRSHHTVLSEERALHQIDASTPQEFQDRGVPWSKGVFNTHSQPVPARFLQARPAVNLMQLMETDTIEFRHFPGTLDDEELLTAVEWCQAYLTCAYAGNNSDPVERFFQNFSTRKWPHFLPYVHWMEVRWTGTILDSHKGPRKEALANIERYQHEACPGSVSR